MSIITKPTALPYIVTEPTAPPYNGLDNGLVASSRERSLVDFGLTSTNKGVQRFARAYIKSKQPTYSVRAKIFFREIKEYPQTVITKVKNIFTSIYQHPTVPFIGAGLLGVAIGSVIGLSIPAGFMLGVVIKLGGIGLDYGLEAISSASTRAFNRLRRAKSETEKGPRESSLKQTLKLIPIGVLCFSVGLNSYSFTLAVKIATSIAAVAFGSFALGSAYASNVVSH